MKTSIVLFAVMCIAQMYAQVGIGTTDPDTSAALDVSSTTQGFLPPRMTKANRDAIASPEAGLLIWCTNCGTNGQIQVFNGSFWSNIGDAGLNVGDAYGGGIVGYILQLGDPNYMPGQIHGLIVAPSDQSAGAMWGCYAQLIGTNIGLGTGQTNTTDIVAECGDMGTAARICNDLVLNGYSDWYLPSKDELNKLNLNQFIIGGFTAEGHYWTSSEETNNLAWKQVFPNGYQNGNSKTSVLRVRAVRSF
ncbi:MAG TPA: DUF1566 domain-containing protein [Saprospiraceae bacterium]|nr:DUF1566 domain-containing protein [Saprospiraceae bacterium]